MPKSTDFISRINRCGGQSNYGASAGERQTIPLHYGNLITYLRLNGLVPSGGQNWNSRF